MICRRFVALAALTLGLLAAPRANADEPLDNKGAAAKAFRVGQEAFAAKNYAVAAAAFEDAHRRIPRAAAIYNAALSWDAAGDAARAADDLWIALEKTDLHGADADRARARLVELEAHLGIVDVTGAEGLKLSVAHVQHAAPPLHVHLEPGHYPIVVEDDPPREISVDVAAGDRKTIAIPTVAHPLPRPSAPIEDRTRGVRTAGWISLGVGVAGGVATLVLGAMTLSAISSYSATDYTDVEAYDRAISLRTATIATGIGAAAVGVAGIVMLVVGYAARRSPVKVDASGLALAF